VRNEKDVRLVEGTVRTGHVLRVGYEGE
jgi:hypothetical protein